MKAVLLEGTPEEIAEFMRTAGYSTAATSAAVASPAVRSPSSASDIGGFIAATTKGNSDKARLVGEYVESLPNVGPLRVQVAVKENGQQNDYLTARLTTVDENKIGNVAYCRPASATVWLRLPVEAIDGSAYANRIDSKKAEAEFKKVKHQVIVKLVNEDAVREAISLTETAVNLATSNEW